MRGTHGHGTADLDLREYGAPKDGERQVLESRLFMQLMVFDCPSEIDQRR